jgi:putative ABC transport system ATP-binding protein
MIQVKNLTKTFKPGSDQAFHALKNITFEVKENELVILQGVSGSGKSTLLAIIASLMKPTSGEVLVEGKQVAKLPDLHASHFRASTIGFIFQAFNLLEHLNVAENISIPLIPLGLRQKEIDQKVSKAMQLANIAHKANSAAKDLSGGEKQRCAIARALVNSPRIILCDEPTANLDKANALAFIDVIKKLKQEGYTILIATHDTIFENLPEIDKVIYIENGEIK